MDVSHLTIHLERCNNATRVEHDCKSDEEITFWLRRKFIITLINHERYDPTLYTEDKISREGVFTVNPIKSTVVEEVVNKIQISRLKLQDNKWVQLGDLTEETHDLFAVELRSEYRPFEFAGMNVHFALNYEMDLNLYEVERKVGSYFDCISSAGGLNKGLRLLL